MSALSLDNYSRPTAATPQQVLLRKIHKACRISLVEPNLAYNLDVADYINEKQGPAPRDAAIAIVKLINSHDSHSAVFALNLLDVLVKNCGYPFHLQISRKDFLNELVKRFPERPPPRYTRVQRLILAAIEEWYQTLCKHSRYKEDLGFIRDMHRLLKYKGYAFPEIKQEDLSVLRESDTLKTAAEIQKEQDIAQAAKLEELIRRGRPQDLQEANKLMKVMAGFKEDNVVASKNQVYEELGKLKTKSELLHDMLQSGEINETVTELYSALKSAQLKFQTIIEEEDDEAKVQELLHFNDVVNTLINQYQSLKGIEPTTNTVAAKQSLNLIDFDDEPESSPAPAGSAADGLLDLMDLQFGNGGGITLGSIATPKPATQASPFDALAGLSMGSTSSAPVASAPAASGSLLDDFADLTIAAPASNTAAPVASTKSLVSSTQVKIEFSISRESSETVKVIVFFSNTAASTINNLSFSLAVPKSLSLRLEAQTGNHLNSFATDGITQVAHIDKAVVGKALKVKWKVNYTVNGSPVEETNTFTLPNV